MPNLAAETGDMAAAVTREGVTDEVRELLDDVGEFAEIDESKMDIATAANGSGPAFFLSYSGDGGRGRRGRPRVRRRRDAGRPDVQGAAETVLRSDRSVEELIDAVCSPNGTTIEGMEVLWNSDADADVAAAVTAAEERSAELASEFANEDDE